MNAAPQPLDREAPVYVAGHRGLAGGAVWRHLEREGFTNLIGATSNEVDLRDRDAAHDLISTHKPEVIVLAAARVGGIIANRDAPTEFLADNLRIQLNVLGAAHEVGVPRLLFLGSSCIYPKLAAQPIREDSLMTGPLEPTNEAYAVAKIAGVVHVQALRRQYGLDYISAMPTNLYGPGDNFDAVTSHVLPSLIRRYHEAKVTEAPSVMNWGSGSPLREFLHVDDLASACLFLLENYSDSSPVNVGFGEEISIADLAALVAEVVEYKGTIEWDTSRPDGTPRKLLDSGTIRELGWRPRIGLREGIQQTYAWLLEHPEALEGRSAG